MIVNNHILQGIRILSISLFLFLLIPAIETGRTDSDINYSNPFAGGEFVFAISLSNELTSGQGLETGYNYQLIKQFEKDNHCKIKVLIYDGPDYIDSLKSGSIDIIITRKEELLDSGEVTKSLVFDDLYVWGISDDPDKEKVTNINRWIQHVSCSEQIGKLRTRFRGSFNPTRLAEKGEIRDRVSPYDNIMKQYADSLGWDWRLLAAVIYQESRFSIKAQSHRKASGLMQIMPGIAEHYGVSDLIDPEQNIIAGTRILAKLQGRWQEAGLAPGECINFTLASYNAGEARIKDCRNLARAKGYNADKWAEVVKVIPLMREESTLDNGILKLGTFQGHETIRYVNSVMSLYEAICKIHPGQETI